MTFLKCMKCGRQTPEGPMNLQHEFCVYCGAKYPYGLMDLKDESDPLYRTILELHNIYWKRREQNNGHDRLISNAASNFLFKIASTSLIESLQRQFPDDETAEQLVNKYQTSLTWYFLNLLVDGSLAGFATCNYEKGRVDNAPIPSEEFFENECRELVDDVYSQYMQALMGSKDGLLITKDVASVLTNYEILQGRKWFEMIKDAKALESIYSGIQAIGCPAIVSGYAVAIVDAKYRNG